MLYFDEPWGELKYKQRVKFSAILHNKTSNKRFTIQHPKILCLGGRISRIFIYGECVTGSMRSGMELARDIQQTDWSTAREQGKLVFVVSIKPSLAQFISLFTAGKKSSFDCPNHASIQAFHCKISVKKKCRKEIVLINFFFVTSIQFAACAL